MRTVPFHHILKVFCWTKVKYGERSSQADDVGFLFFANWSPAAVATRWLYPAYLGCKERFLSYFHLDDPTERLYFLKHKPEVNKAGSGILKCLMSLLTRPSEQRSKKPLMVLPLSYFPHLNSTLTLSLETLSGLSCTINMFPKQQQLLMQEGAILKPQEKFFLTFRMENPTLWRLFQLTFHEFWLSGMHHKWVSSSVGNMFKQILIRMIQPFRALKFAKTKTCKSELIFAFIQPIWPA